MKKLLKRILTFVIGIFFIGLILYQISLRSQDEERNYNKYGIVFNDKRAEVGLKKLSENWNYKYYNDSEIPNSGLINKIIQTFKFKNIETGISYQLDTLTKDKFHVGKFTWINSNAMFWKNGISAEMDTYERNIDSVTSEHLSITYYFCDDNGNKDYFETDHYISKLDEFICGTSTIAEKERQRNSGKPYFGNITKKQADSILKNWNQN